MSFCSDYLDEMRRFPLDLDTADRLLGGSVAPEDAPPGFAGLAAALSRVDAPADEEPLDEELLVLLATTVRSSPKEETNPSRRSIVPRIKLAAALAGALLVGTAGLAVAGALPGAAQDIASSMLAKAGVTVPGPNSKAGDNPNTRGSSSEHTSGLEGSSGQGSEISDLATSDLSGHDKGAAVSAVASDGKSAAGEAPAAQTAHAPVETPNGGGTGTADVASSGASSEGTTKAAEESGGRSSAGAENAAEGQSHRP